MAKSKSKKTAIGITLLGLAALGAYALYEKKKAADALTYGFGSLNLSKMKSPADILALKMTVGVKITNPTNTPLTFTSFQGTIIYNNQTLGIINFVNHPALIKAKSVTTVLLPVTANTSNILANAWNIVSSGQKEYATLKGTVVSGSLSVPIDLQIPIKNG